MTDKERFPHWWDDALMSLAGALAVMAIVAMLF